MVGIDLEGCKDSREQQSPEVFAPISQHDTGYHRWQISQRPHLPDVARSNDNQEIRGARPDDTTQGSQMLTEVESPQQDIEAQQISKHIPHVLRQPQVIGIHSLRQHLRRTIRGRHLVSRHTSEQGVCPSAALARLLSVLNTLLTSTASCRGIVAIQNSPLDISGEEVGKGQNGKQ